MVVEQTINAKAQKIWLTSNPLLAMLRKKSPTNWNSDMVQIVGAKALIPIMFNQGGSAAAGVADANELTPDPLEVTQGFTEAEYEFAHYRRPITYRNSELTLVQGGGVRINLDQKVDQLIGNFETVIENAFVSNSNGSRTTLMGLRYMLSTSNTVGNISQGTYPDWQAGVQTNVGQFSLDPFNAAIDRINALGRCRPDLIMCSYSGSNNVFGRFRDSLQSSQVLVSQESEANYGFESFTYMGKDVVQWQKLGTALPGSAMVLSSSSLYINMLSDAPQKMDTTVIPGTDARVDMYTWWWMHGTSDPACNELITGFAA
jgi:hypothetical protein